MPGARVLGNPAVLLGVCITLDVILAAVRIHASTAPSAVPVLRQFAATIDEQYHECVPLGWFPDSRPWRAYFPGYSANVAAKDGMYQGLWVAVLPSRKLDDPQVSAVKSVLDELTRLDLLARSDVPGGVRYNLTDDGRQYYYEGNDLRNNVEQWPYLCFSRLRAKRVAWASRVTQVREARGSVTMARVRFTWEPGEGAPWATPFIKQHAVELNPTSSPAEVAARRRYDGRWKLTELDFAFPLVEHRSAWIAAR